MRNICVVTGTRAEYGLLSGVMSRIKNDPALNLQIIATGMHLSPEFGTTVNEIINDGFTVDRRLEILLSSDSAIGISKSLGLGIIGFADAFDILKPDIVVILGDRFEILAAAQAALFSKIFVAHISGGEQTLGAVDETIRHCITKIANIHLTSTEAYRKRVIQLGENPKAVFNVGALCLDNIANMTLLDKDSLFQTLNLTPRNKFFLITFHPETASKTDPIYQLKELFSALDQFEDSCVLFTKANCDEGGRAINETISKYVEKNSERMVLSSSLGQLRYLSAVATADVVIGNSSSGIIEVPALKVPSVNIGDRQRGRLKGPSVIDCKCQTEEITNSIKLALDPNFHQKINYADNPYGTPDGLVSKRIIDTLKIAKISDSAQKIFHDLAFTENTL